MIKVSKKIRFNGMDLFIIIVLVAVIAAGAFILGGREKTVTSADGSEGTEIAFAVELTSREKDYTELIKVGDTVLVGEKDKKESVVTDVEVVPAKTTGYDILNGQVLRSELPGEYDVRVYLSGKGSESESAIKLGGTTELRVGQGVALSSKKWTGYGYVIGLDIVK